MPNKRRSTVSTDIQAIRSSLSSIDNALRRLGPALAQITSAQPRAAGRAPKLTLSRDRRAALKLQGQYMGYIRNLKPREKTRVKALRVAKGIHPAIKLAKKLATA